jgi:hypothetical protein
METAENKWIDKVNTSEMVVAILVVRWWLWCGFLCGKPGICEVSLCGAGSSWGGWSRPATRGGVAEKIGEQGSDGTFHLDKVLLLGGKVVHFEECFNGGTG